ncbi:ABC transporter ATP-binding protein [Thermincola potens]|uniref:ABC transporter related protein n=1 Tax=Thermincola potens (strain JR) TaxID=635013 RepID=D5XDZ7_THEPJ|nr:ABC transporter ATP-binding protein [Thermincola potens]ADG81868.1 ABC transporter related protein [Thermincola potens JR]
MIRLENVSLTYNQANTSVQALQNVSLEIVTGSRLAIIGPSGCGKSSLLFLMAGLYRPTSGEIYISGQKITGPRQETALILQDYGLFPWKTVWQNACLGLEIRGVAPSEQRKIVAPILEQLGLGEFTHHYPTQLSGGQRQRVAIARALALQPDLLLMDEPLSSLDALTRENLQDFLLDIWQRHRFTLVLVTHSIDEAAYLGDYIAVMSDRPGRIVSLVENAGSGSKNFRQSQHFHTQCNNLRHMLGVGAV